MNERSISHLTAQEHQAVTAFIRRLHERFPGEILDITLFGSKARGDSGLWSDVDILVIVTEESWPRRAEISMLAADVSLAYDVLLAPRVIGRERWERMKQDQFSLYRNIVAEGISLAPVLS